MIEHGPGWGGGGNRSQSTAGRAKGGSASGADATANTGTASHLARPLSGQPVNGGGDRLARRGVRMRAEPSGAFGQTERQEEIALPGETEPERRDGGHRAGDLLPVDMAGDVGVPGASRLDVARWRRSACSVSP